MFNKLRSFPEWHVMDNTLELSAKSSAKRKLAIAQSQGEGFTEFARKQPEVISDVLFELDKKMKLLDPPLQKNDSALSEMRTELVKLQPYHDDIKAKAKLHQKAKDTAAKSTLLAEKAEKRLEAVRAKGVDLDIKKADDEYDAAVRRKQEDIAAFEALDAQFAEDIKVYKKNIFSTILTAMSRYAGGRAESCATMVGVGNELAETAARIPSFEDISIEKLRNRLQTLRTEPID